MNKKEYSKYLSYLLRHHPEAANLHMNDQGFVLIDELIQSSGAILPMSRQFVHLSKDKETAKKVGKRHSHNDMPVIIVIDTKKMLEDGRQLFESENGVVLAERVEIKYFVRVE